MFNRNKPQPLRTNVHIDGFNLYYGALRNTSYRWLDLVKLCNVLLPAYSINRINYFTALVHSRYQDPQAPQRQQTYLRALNTLQNVDIYYGHFLSNSKRMPLAHPSPTGPKTVEVIATEEKGSDVNLATVLLVDAFSQEFDVAVVISNDSDLKLPIDLIRKVPGLQVGVFNPQKVKSWALANVADFYRPIRKGALSASQFPVTLTDSQGQFTKPASW